MSRSVSVPNNAQVVCYRDVSGFEDSWEWDDFVEDIRETCKSEWNSFYDSDSWLDREDHVLLENSLSYVGVSEYCGLASIWIVPKDEDEVINIAPNWVDQISKKFNKYFGQYRKVATFSNGEAMFEQV